MKNIFILFVSILLLAACKEEAPKNYATLSGKITNKNSSEILVRNYENQLIKTIVVAENGSFKDTLNVSKGKYSISDGNEYASVYLRPGDNISITLDAEKFDETLVFDGKGSLESTYMIKKLLLQEKVFENINDLYSLSRIDFNMSLDETKKKFQNLLKNEENLDPNFIQTDITDTKSLFKYLGDRYEKVSKVNKLIGSPSPLFKDYENINGKTTSLTELKGKYVYIDVWATWCKPCLAEIPALKKLEKEFGKKMHFVSISIDKKDKHKAWKKMVAEKELKGVQLFADNNWESTFVQDYGIDGIPRFILIDPQGNVVKPDASRPSNPKTKELFRELLK